MRVHQRGRSEKKSPRKATVSAANGRLSLGNRVLQDAEKQARLKADRMLNLLVPEAVRTLRSILRDPTSTKFDRISAAEKVLDRKIPRLSSAEVNLRNAPPVLVNIPGFNWPKPIADRLGDSSGNGDEAGA